MQGDGVADRLEAGDARADLEGVAGKFLQADGVLAEGRRQLGADVLGRLEGLGPEGKTRAEVAGHRTQLRVDERQALDMGAQAVLIDLLDEFGNSRRRH